MLLYYQPWLQVRVIWIWRASSLLRQPPVQNAEEVSNSGCEIHTVSGSQLGSAATKVGHPISPTYDVSRG